MWSTISFIVKFRLVLTFRVPSPPLSTATVEQGEGTANSSPEPIPAASLFSGVSSADEAGEREINPRLCIPPR